jgi:hypothetical protein
VEYKGWEYQERRKEERVGLGAWKAQLEKWRVWIRLVQEALVALEEEKEESVEDHLRQEIPMTTTTATLTPSQIFSDTPYAGRNGTVVKSSRSLGPIQGPK